MLEEFCEMQHLQTCLWAKFWEQREIKSLLHEENKTSWWIFICQIYKVWFTCWSSSIFRSLMWPIAMSWRLSSSVLRGPITYSSQGLLGQSLPNLVCSCCTWRGWRYKVVNFMIPHLMGILFWGKEYFLKIFFSTTGHKSNKKNENTVMMTKEG